MESKTPTAIEWFNAHDGGLFPRPVAPRLSPVPPVDAFAWQLASTPDAWFASAPSASTDHADGLAHRVEGAQQYERLRLTVAPLPGKATDKRASEQIAKENLPYRLRQISMIFHLVRCITSTEIAVAREQQRMAIRHLSPIAVAPTDKEWPALAEGVFNGIPIVNQWRTLFADYVPYPPIPPECKDIRKIRRINRRFYLQHVLKIGKSKPLDDPDSIFTAVGPNSLNDILSFAESLGEQAIAYQLITAVAIRAYLILNGRVLRYSPGSGGAAFRGSRPEFLYLVFINADSRQKAALPLVANGVNMCDYAYQTSLADFVTLALQVARARSEWLRIGGTSVAAISDEVADNGPIDIAVDDTKEEGPAIATDGGGGGGGGGGGEDEDEKASKMPSATRSKGARDPWSWIKSNFGRQFRLTLLTQRYSVHDIHGLHTRIQEAVSGMMDAKSAAKPITLEFCKLFHKREDNMWQTRLKIPPGNRNPIVEFLYPQLISHYCGHPLQPVVPTLRRDDMLSWHRRMAGVLDLYSSKSQEQLLTPKLTARIRALHAAAVSSSSSSSSASSSIAATAIESICMPILPVETSPVATRYMCSIPKHSGKYVCGIPRSLLQQPASSLALNYEPHLHTEYSLAWITPTYVLHCQRHGTDHLDASSLLSSSAAVRTRAQLLLPATSDAEATEKIHGVYLSKGPIKPSPSPSYGSHRVVGEKHEAFLHVERLPSYMQEYLALRLKGAEKSTARSLQAYLYVLSLILRFAIDKEIDLVATLYGYYCRRSGTALPIADPGSSSVIDAHVSEEQIMMAFIRAMAIGEICYNSDVHLDFVGLMESGYATKLSGSIAQLAVHVISKWNRRDALQITKENEEMVHLADGAASVGGLSPVIYHSAALGDENKAPSKLSDRRTISELDAMAGAAAVGRPVEKLLAASKIATQSIMVQQKSTSLYASYSDWIGSVQHLSMLGYWCVALDWIGMCCTPIVIPHVDSSTGRISTYSEMVNVRQPVTSSPLLIDLGQGLATKISKVTGAAKCKALLAEIRACGAAIPKEARLALTVMAMNPGPCEPDAKAALRRAADGGDSYYSNRSAIWMSTYSLVTTHMRQPAPVISSDLAWRWVYLLASDATTRPDPEYLGPIALLGDMLVQIGAGKLAPAVHGSGAAAAAAADQKRHSLAMSCRHALETLSDLSDREVTPSDSIMRDLRMYVRTRLSVWQQSRSKRAPATSVVPLRPIITVASPATSSSASTSSSSSNSSSLSSLSSSSGSSVPAKRHVTFAPVAVTDGDDTIAPARKKTIPTADISFDDDDDDDGADEIVATRGTVGAIRALINKRKADAAAAAGVATNGDGGGGSSDEDRPTRARVV